ncbi:MAG: hypothetical protein R2728_05045 [Chitinophagales bacterium]
MYAYDGIDQELITNTYTGYYTDTSNFYIENNDAILVALNSQIVQYEMSNFYVDTALSFNSKIMWDSKESASQHLIIRGNVCLMKDIRMFISEQVFHVVTIKLKHGDMTTEYSHI